MPGREQVKISRKLVAFRLMSSQVNRIEEMAKATGKSKTAVVEDAVWLYHQMLKREGVV